MKKKYINIGLAIFAVIITVTIPMHMAHAGGVASSIASVATGAVLNVISYLVNIVFEVEAWLLAIQGALLNMSIVLTMSIKSFLAGAPGVYIVWQTLRDLSGMFVIFALLFASFKVILGLDDKVGSLITHVVIAGILINFSFFITGALIDASNIVSLSIYNQMMPTGQQVSGAGSTSVADQIKTMATNFTTAGAQNKGGISAMIIQSLKVQSILDPKNANFDNVRGDVSTAMNILFMQVISILIMMITGLSFVIAAGAFIVRTVLLIFLLAFSPVWFVSMIFPGLKSAVSDRFWNTLKSQLIFMPAYLLMMYIALKVISSMGSMLGDPSAIAALAQKTPPIPFGSVSVILINYAFVAIMLNLPLVVAASLNSSLGNLKGKFGAAAIMGKITSKAGQYAKSSGNWAARNTYQGTVGRAASAVSRSEGLKDFAANWKVGEVLHKGLQKTAGGYDKKLDAQVKAKTEYASSLGHDQSKVNKEKADLRTEADNLRNVNAAEAGGHITAAQAATARAAIKVRTDKAKENITTIENERKFNYADRTNSRSVDTIYTKKARKNKVAAAKIHIDVYTEQLKDLKDKLKDSLSEMKTLQGQINQQPTGVGTAAQLQAKSNLQGTIDFIQGAIDKKEVEIEKFNLVK